MMKEKATATATATTGRFRCERCAITIHSEKIKHKRVPPLSPPPWAEFEYMRVPVCPLCDGDVVDLYAPVRAQARSVVDYVAGDGDKIE